MRQSSNLASGNNRYSLSRFECPHVDKTFPELTGKLRKADSYDSREETYKTTMKEYEKKFYKDEIRFLLSKFHKMEIKAKKQESEIERMRRQMEKMHQVKRSYSQIEFESEFHSQNDEERSSEGPSIILSTRFKGNSDAKTFEAKSEYERKVNKLEKEHECELKSIRFEHQRKIVKMENEMEEFRKQKRHLEKEVKELKEIKEMKNSVDAGRDNEGLKEENAFLRSYIEKEMGSCEQKIEKLEESRMRERKEFVEETQILETENKKLSERLDCLKTFYEEKMKHLENDLKKKMYEKTEKLTSLEEENSSLLKVQSELIRSQIEERTKKLFNDSMEEERHINSKSQVESVRDSECRLEKCEAELQEKIKKEETKIEKLCKEVEELKRNEQKYYKEIERLRIERNQTAIENTEMQQKINILTQELRHGCGEKERKKEDVSGKRVSSFDINKDIEQVEEFNACESEELKNKVKELEEELKKEKEKHSKEHAAVELFYQGRENSLRLSKEMAEHSYTEIWEKQKDMLEKLEKEKGKSEEFERQMKDVEIKLLGVEELGLLKEKEKEMMMKEVECLRNKNVCLEKELLESIEKIGELEKLVHQKTDSINQIKDINQELTKDIIEKEKVYQNELAIRDKEIGENKKQLEEQMIGYDRVICEYKMRIGELEKQVEVVEKSMVEMRIGFNKVVEDREKTIGILKDEIDKNEFKSIMKAKENPNLLQDSKMHKSFFHNDRISMEQKAEQYQEQILQINFNHQQEIDHLKAYICELLNDNERLNQSYLIAANSWKEMFQGALKYNHFLDEGHQQFEICTSRKNRIEVELELSKSRRENLKFSKVSKVSQWSRVVENTESKNDFAPPLSGIEVFKNEDIIEDKEFSCGIKSEIYEVPDFSDRKVFSKHVEKEVMSDFKTEGDRMKRNGSQEIEDQLKLSYHRVNEGQENLNESNFDFESITKNSENMKSKKNEGE